MGVVNTEGFAYIGPLNGNSRQIVVPYPDYDDGAIEAQTLVDSARNANGVVVATKVGRTNYKVNMKWNILENEYWIKLMKFFKDNFFFQFTFFNTYEDKWQTLECYVGNISGKPIFVNTETGRQKFIKDASFNVIDTGK